eukprot:403358282
MADVHAMYDTRWCGHLCFLVKSLGNIAMFQERSVMRNLIFDLVRGVIRTAIYPIIFNGAPNWPMFVEMTISCSVISILCTLLVPKSWFKRHNVAWSYMNVEFFLLFTDSFIFVMNQVERMYHGQFIYFIIGFLLESQLGLMGWIVEDMFYRDINMIGGLWHNWGFHVYYVILTPLLFGLQYFFHGTEFYRPDGQIDVNDISKHLHSEQKFPIKWNIIERSDPNAWIYYLAGNGAFLGIYLIYQFSYYKSLEVEKHEALKKKLNQKPAEATKTQQNSKSNKKNK